MVIWIVEDLLSALDEWFRGLLADGIIGALSTTNDLLTGALNNSDNTGISGMFSQYLGDPTTFTGSTDTSAVTIWSKIETLTNNVIVPIGSFMLMIVVIYELFYMVVENNNFRDTDTSFFIRWILKTFCGILLVSNVFYITTGIYSFGTKAVTQGLSSLFGTGGFVNTADLISGDSFKTSLMANNIGTLIITLIISFVIVIVTFVLLAAIIIVLAARLIDVYMYLSISPIPMATMMNKDWGDIGRNWLRNVIALAFQGFFIIVALSIFQTLFSNTLQSLKDSTDIIMTMATLLGFIVALIFTMFRTGNISKSAFGAH